MKSEASGLALCLQEILKKQQKQQKASIKTREEDRTKEQTFAMHTSTQLIYLGELLTQITFRDAELKI